MPENTPLTTPGSSLGVVSELREYAEAIDKDRGHDKSYVTAVMREAAARIEQLDAMVVASEEHTQHWEDRAKRLESALELIADGETVTVTSGDPFPIWIDGEVRSGKYATTLRPAAIARRALKAAE